MMLTVYRQDAEPLALDTSVVIKMSASDTDLDLIGLCMRTRHPCLIGLGDAAAIIKPVEDGDSHQTFAGLYDECYTLGDLERMKRRGTSTPDTAPDDTFDVAIDCAIQGVFTVSVRLRAKNHGDARVRFRALLDNDPSFAGYLRTHLVTLLVQGHGEIVTRVRDARSDVPQLGEGDAYKFVSADDE